VRRGSSLGISIGGVSKAAMTPTLFGCEHAWNASDVNIPVWNDVEPYKGGR